MYDTSYTIAATARESEIPEDKLTEIDGLSSIRGYFLERYSKRDMVETTVSLDEDSSDGKADLF